MGSVHGAGLTDVGQVRDHNEDAILVQAPIFAVADGVGGAEAGEVASGLAIDAISSAGADLVVASRGPVDTAQELLKAVVEGAHNHIRSIQVDGDGRPGMATTLTAALVMADGTVVCGHVGDSRAYRITATNIVQITDDHSLVGELVRSGRITADEARHHPQGNVITQALGSAESVSVDTPTATLSEGEWVLLCSDGLSGMVDDATIADAVRSATSPDAATARLIDLANAGGGTDNISAVVIAGGAPSAHVYAGMGDVAEPAAAIPPPSPARSASNARQHSRRWLLVAAAIIAVLGTVVVWNQSYYVDELGDGTVGIRQGFPLFGANTVHETTDLRVDELSSFDVNELVDSHTLRSRENAEQVVQELIDKRLPVASDSVADDDAATAPQDDAAPQSQTDDQPDSAATVGSANGGAALIE